MLQQCGNRLIRTCATALLAGALAPVSGGVGVAQSRAWTVITSHQDTLRSVSIGSIEGTGVTLVQAYSVRMLPVDSLAVFMGEGESRVWEGVGYGALIGGAAGAVIAVAAHDRPQGQFSIDFGPGVDALAGGVLGGLVGGIAGAVVGAVAGGDRVYDLTHETTKDKILILHALRSQHE